MKNSSNFVEKMSDFKSQQHCKLRLKIISSAFVTFLKFSREKIFLLAPLFTLSNCHNFVRKNSRPI